MGFIYIYVWLTPVVSQDSWQQKASIPSPIFWAQFPPDLLDQQGKGKQHFQVMKIFLWGGEVWMSVWGVWCECHDIHTHTTTLHTHNYTQYIQLYSREVFLHKKAVSRLTDK